MIKVDKEGHTTEVWYDEKGRRCESTDRPISSGDEIEKLENMIASGDIISLDDLDDFIERKKRSSIIEMFLHPIRTFRLIKNAYEGEETRIM